MTTQANISLNDGAATPAAHTFVAVGVNGNGVAKWVEKTTSTLPAGFFTLTSSLKIPSKPGDAIRGQVKLIVPTVVTETINGVDYMKVARTALVSCDVVCAGDSTQQERKDLMQYFKNFCDFTLSTQTFGYQLSAIDPVI